MQFGKSITSLTTTSNTALGGSGFNQSNNSSNNSNNNNYGNNYSNNNNSMAGNSLGNKFGSNNISGGTNAGPSQFQFKTGGTAAGMKTNASKLNPLGSQGGQLGAHAGGGTPSFSSTPNLNFGSKQNSGSLGMGMVGPGLSNMPSTPLGNKTQFNASFTTPNNNNNVQSPGFNSSFNFSGGSNMGGGPAFGGNGGSPAFSLGSKKKTSSKKK
jgi:hypothetical protein